MSILDAIRRMWARLLHKRKWRVKPMDGEGVVIMLPGEWTQEGLAQFKAAWKKAWEEER